MKEQRVSFDVSASNFFLATWWWFLAFSLILFSFLFDSGCSDAQFVSSHCPFADCVCSYLEQFQFVNSSLDCILGLLLFPTTVKIPLRTKSLFLSRFDFRNGISRFLFLGFPIFFLFLFFAQSTLWLLHWTTLPSCDFFFPKAHILQPYIWNDFEFILWVPLWLGFLIVHCFLFFLLTKLHLRKEESRESGKDALTWRRTNKNQRRRAITKANYKERKICASDSEEKKQNREWRYALMLFLFSSLFNTGLFWTSTKWHRPQCRFN